MQPNKLHREGKGTSTCLLKHLEERIICYELFAWLLMACLCIVSMYTLYSQLCEGDHG